MDLAKLHCFGCCFSYWKVTKGKSFSHCLCLLVSWKGLVQGPSVSVTKVQRTKCYEETLPGSSPTRIKAATTVKGGQRVSIMWEELEVPQG